MTQITQMKGLITNHQTLTTTKWGFWVIGGWEKGQGIEPQLTANKRE
jgi:hypothetical protein